MYNMLAPSVRNCSLCARRVARAHSLSLSVSYLGRRAAGTQVARASDDCLPVETYTRASRSQCSISLFLPFSRSLLLLYARARNEGEGGEDDRRRVNTSRGSGQQRSGRLLLRLLSVLVAGLAAYPRGVERHDCGSGDRPSAGARRSRGVSAAMCVCVCMDVSEGFQVR